ncbi:hypothetical protein PPACK8108_LOCUS21505 [Phakopsora pachyrhizi]|uniref:Uncharacterized protein n=1 Tax=Phakopsora pachyrhizi TaxID=170000 RepID=A0AAV0BKD4_PHAPC|nr:hypothetical protein PPACK8108_LOCUS21505 [Phakopsora pachyrhizi]
MRLDILAGNPLKDEIYEPYDAQTIEEKVWRNLCWITSRATLERARNIFDSNYLEENWEVFCKVEDSPSKVILRLPTMPYGHSSRKRDGDNTREDKKGKLTYAQTDNVRNDDYYNQRLESEGRQGGASGPTQGQVFFARDKLENGRNIEGERVEASRMKRMRMEVKTTYIYKAMKVAKRESQMEGSAKVESKGSESSKAINGSGEVLRLLMKGMDVANGVRTPHLEDGGDGGGSLQAI